MSNESGTPLTGYDRELGTMSAQLKELIHKQRNNRMILDDVVREVTELRAEIAKLRTTIRTTLYILGVVAAVVGWLIEITVKV